MSVATHGDDMLTEQASPTACCALLTDSEAGNSSADILSADQLLVDICRDARLCAESALLIRGAAKAEGTRRASSAVNARAQRELTERKAVKVRLRNFETAFAARHGGRKPRKKDWDPVRTDYDRYAGLRDAEAAHEDAMVLAGAGPLLKQWEGLLDVRPALARAFEALGVRLRGEREAIINAISTASRRGRLPGAGGGLMARCAPPRTSTPPPLEELDRQAQEALRSCPVDQQLLAQATQPTRGRAAGCQRDEGTPLDGGAGPATVTKPASPLDAAAEARLHSRLVSNGMDGAHAKVLLGSLATRGVRIGFYSSQLSERGTETALFDYADYAERLLGTCSYILYDGTSEKNVPAAQARFAARFGSRVVALGAAGGAQAGSPLRELPIVIAREQITHVYVIKFGAPDEPSVAHFGGARTLIHAVFDARAPHGDVFARISPTVPSAADAGSDGSRRPCPDVPVVPHIVRRRETEGTDLRAELGIPADVTVFGRYGGWNVFDIFGARQAVLRVARARPRDVYFLFMNTQELAIPAGESPPPNVIYLPASVDDARKSAFIRTCDAMLHARWSGETFGLAIAEFSASNRPVLTSSVHDDDGMARFHIDALGRRGLFYHDAASCERALLDFDAAEAKLVDWNAYRPYEPEPVMARFREVFLRDVLPAAGGEGAAEESLGCGGDEGEARRQFERLVDSGTAMPCCGWGLPLAASEEEEERRQAAFDHLKRRVRQ